MNTSAHTPRAPLITVLRSPRVPRLLSASLIGRLPYGMAPLAIVLAVRHNEGDYQLAGMLTALYAAAAAVCGPVLGRLIDRTRQPPILLGSAAASTAAFAALAMINPVASPAVAAMIAAVAGGATPQREPCLRVLWERLVPSQRALQAAFSLDAATQELIFVCGPLVVLAATSAAGASGGLLAAAAIGFAGTVWFTTARPSREWRAAPSKRHWAGPLRTAGMLRLFAALVCIGTTIGSFTVGMTGYADAAGALGSASWLIALNATGALLGSLAYTTIPAANREDRRFVLLVLLLAVGYLPLTATPGLLGMVPLSVLSGCALPAVLASAFALVARMAPEGTITEAHSWMITSFGVGNAVGSAVAGTLIDLITPAAAFLVAAASGVIAFTLAVRPLLPNPKQNSSCPIRVS